MKQARAVIAAAALLLAAGARAHGPAPAALSALAATEGAPTVIRTNIGLATHWEGADFRYLCPAQWAGDDEEGAPLIGRLGDGRLLAVPAGGPWLGDARGCAFTRLDLPWDAAVPLDLFPSDDGGLWLVTRRPGGSAVWRVDAAGVPSRHLDLDAVALDSGGVDAAGRLWLASARPAPRLLRQGADGAWEERALALPSPPAFLELRAFDATAPDAFFLSAALDEGAALLETRDGGAELAPRFTGVTRLHGPAPLGDGLLVLIDGVLHGRVPGGDFQALGERPWTCLQHLPGLTLACMDRGLAALTGPALAPEATPRFAMTDLRGVDPTCPADDAARAACDQQWLHFAAEGGLLRPMADVGPPDSGSAGDAGDADLPDAGPAPRGGDDGCAQATGGGGWWLLPALLCLRRRRR